MEIKTIEISFKAKSKHEMYSLLSGPNGIYLPPEDGTHYKYIQLLC